MGDPRIDETVVAAVATAARLTPGDCADPALRLWHELGIDSLGLRRLIQHLEARFGITVPDEDTGQAHTVGDLQAIVHRLADTSRPAGPDQTGTGTYTMTARIIQPRGRGYLLFDSHPAGCARLVQDMSDQVAPASTAARDDRPTALIIGSSAGYGLAAAIAGIRRYGIQGVGLCFERPPNDRRTATAGWYRTIATAELAAETESRFSFVNGDAFADDTKRQVLDLLAKQYEGGIDYLIYSVAAPRRTDPVTGQTHQSALKPLDRGSETKTLDFGGDTPTLKDVWTDPATDDEKADTIKVMGGEDWALWVDALAGQGLLRPGFTTVALSYIGSHLTEQIYRQGTIGAAKAHLENTALILDGELRPDGGRALTSVNGAAVTQASTAIPGIALYTSLLRGVLGKHMHSPIAQSIDMWDQLTNTRPLQLDDEGRLRLDGWELDPAVQEQVSERWEQVTADNVGDLADIGWFTSEVHRLYGFDVPGIDYAAPYETDLPWPA